MGARWYIATFQQGQEAIAERNLRRQGFNVWTPCHIRIVSHARRLQKRRVPLFPCYMFISIDIALDRWRAVNGTFGVRSLIMQGGRPLPCPIGLVEGLKALTDGDGLLNTTTDFAVGDKVRVVAGPFADAVGSLVRLDADDRVRILLQILNADIAVTLDRWHLVSATS